MSLDISVETIENILNQYEVKFAKDDLDAAGLIMYDRREILVNFYCSQDGPTLLHEALHHYFDKEVGIGATEDVVEKYTEILYKNQHIKKFVDNYEIKCIAEGGINEYLK